MSLSSTNITSSSKNITLCFSIIILCLLSITFLTGNIFGISLSSNNTNNASALTYSNTTDISFTFSPKLSISLSDTNLVIDTLVPGQTSTSNAITITVASNTPYGYSLYADAGSNNTSSPYYNTSNLIHEDNTINNTFTSIATNASLTSLTTDNTWGYSTSTDNGTTWSTYNGLLPTTGTDSSTSTANPALLIDTKDPADSSKSIAFKVAARASTTQASGTYSNVINFYAVGKPYTPSIDYLTYMQDFAALSETEKQILLASTPIEEVYTLKDRRDNQDYTVAKLRDGKIWMTKNLDLAGRTEITSELSDVSDDYTLPTAYGFQSGNRLPVSSNSGFASDTLTAYVFNSNSTSCVRLGCYSYYSWTAATAGSRFSVTAKNMDVPYSICPKGWRLPSSRTTAATNWQEESDFYRLAVAYGMEEGNTYHNYYGATSDFYMQAGPTSSSIPRFLLAGYYVSGTFNYDLSGGYLSSTSAGEGHPLRFDFNNSFIDTASSTSGWEGYSVRCILR